MFLGLPGANFRNKEMINRTKDIFLLLDACVGIDL